jgi:hypothetical protein
MPDYSGVQHRGRRLEAGAVVLWFLCSGKRLCRGVRSSVGARRQSGLTVRCARGALHAAQYGRPAPQGAQPRDRGTGGCAPRSKCGLCPPSANPPSHRSHARGLTQDVCFRCLVLADWKGLRPACLHRCADAANRSDRVLDWLTNCDARLGNWPRPLIRLPVRDRRLRPVTSG